MTLTYEQLRDLCARRDAGIIAAATSSDPRAANLARGASRRELDALIADGQAARRLMIEANLGLVKSIVGKIVPGDRHQDDYIQEGIVAMIGAVDRYDPNKGPVAAFAAPSIRGAVHNLLSIGGGEHHITLHQAKMRELVRSRTRRLEAAGLPATHSDVARELGQTEQWVARYASYQPPVDLIGEIADRTNQERFDAVGAVPLSKYLRMLPEDERAALHLVHGFAGRPHTLEEAGEAMGISASTVRRRLDSGHRHLQTLAARFDQQLFEGQTVGRPKVPVRGRPGNQTSPALETRRAPEPSRSIRSSGPDL